MADNILDGKESLKEKQSWQERFDEELNHFPNGMILSAQTSNTLEEYIKPKIKEFISTEIVKARQQLKEEIVKGCCTDCKSMIESVYGENKQQQ